MKTEQQILKMKQIFNIRTNGYIKAIVNNNLTKKWLSIDDLLQEEILEEKLWIFIWKLPWNINISWKDEYYNI
jgi:hypothetical protein